MTTSPPTSSSSRLTVKRVHHTWPSRAAPRSHFEDFLLEIVIYTPENRTSFRPKRIHSTASTRISSASNSYQDDPNHWSAIGGHRRQEVSFLKSTPCIGNRAGPRSLIAPAVDICSASGSLKAEPALATDLRNHEASHRVASAREAHEALRLLLRPPLDRARPSPAPELPSHAETPSPDIPTPGPITETPLFLDIASSSRGLARSLSRESFSTASSSEAPETPKTHSSLLVHEWRPTLTDLEHASRFRVQAVCVICKKNGANFPSCPRCGEMWCSRDCRLKGNNGARHTCRRRDVRPHG
ncbi:uncharacterized protein LAESUDRAFT_164293 [Laetiporus sulphureus 93-53]|uniref:HIT-type domain-containing protein n=1 Tax=Laetiporus sulphureus 93-53 TaxID=1314785 RepID=A0A165HQC5_9APHY|nr:uncharacterized protein LAESUDRAFT_164293 [Laetiporus sulphureus 93-53]KZT12045.1 hypothetical protein LAESUDRAFT_164293 [Laetiporus sulphureus 93-53]